jgi:hypothetical protein
MEFTEFGFMSNIKFKSRYINGGSLTNKASPYNIEEINDLVI